MKKMALALILASYGCSDSSIKEIKNLQGEILKVKEPKIIEVGEKKVLETIVYGKDLYQSTFASLPDDNLGKEEFELYFELKPKQTTGYLKRRGDSSRSRELSNYAYSYDYGTYCFTDK